MFTRYIATACMYLLFLAYPWYGSIAGPGDTLVVQTFTWGWPVNPGWLSPKEGKFWFPTQGKQYEKVLLYYTLKCDPSQNPACGEWDYLTYTRLYEHTGVFDSTQLTHPNFTVFGATPDTLRYMNAPLPTLHARQERTARYASVIRLDSAALGAGASSTDALFGSSSGDARSYILWTRTELEAAGITTDTLTAMHLRVEGAGGRAERVTVRLKRFTGTAWQEDLPLQRSGYTTVYDAALDLPEDDVVSIVFTQPFLIWGGGLLAEITVDGAKDIRVAADPLGGSGFFFVAQEADRFLNFQHRSQVDCGDITELDATQAFTAEAWFKADVLRNWSNIVIRAQSNEHRIAIQLGGLEAGRADVYGIVGNGENSHGYTSGRPVAEGAWYHVALVYDGTANQQADRLKIYLNGAQQTLRFSGTIPSITTDISRSLTISSSGTNSMNGGMDEIRLWRSALSAADIRARMHSRITAQDPLYAELISAWSCDEEHGDLLTDLTGRYPGRLAFPQRSAFRGDRPRGYAAMDARPAVVLERGNVTLASTTRNVVDTLLPAPLMIVLYGDTARANIPTDTVLGWPIGFTYTLNPDNTIQDSAAVTPDHLLLKQLHFYYETPFELTRRYELGRYITPYGIGLSLGEGWTWVWDVTDFVHLLKDTVHLTAGNFQELLDMKFVFIEGTPPRDVVRIENVWQGDFALKDFAARVQPKRIALDPAAKTFKLRTTATGHQFSNATNCAEFCPKIHSVLVDGVTRWSWQIIQECSMNPLYPQGGTWIYARAGWCPGMEAMTKEFELTPFITGSEVEIDYESQYDEFGNYVFESQLVSYGEIRHQLDAAIDRIIAPSNHELNGRFNPTCGRPRIVIQNRGAQNLTSVDIAYGYRGGATQQYTWSGALGFMQKADVWLPPLTEQPPSENRIFDVTLNAPNGATDEYTRNDTQHSHFTTVPVFDKRLIVLFRTNNAPGENRYEVLDAEGSVVHSRSGFAANTTYRDTLRLMPGCYEFLLHDSGEDGIAWWANNDGTGSLQFRLDGGELWSTVNPDFGKQARYPFIYSGLVAVEELPSRAAALEMFPNPVTDLLRVRYNDAPDGKLRYIVHDMLGQMVLQSEFRSGDDRIPVSALLPGTYVLSVVEGAVVKAQQSFSIVR
jgi:hypothetical protein